MTRPGSTSSSLTAAAGWWVVPTNAKHPGAQHPGAAHHVLILGGTRDARQLAEALAAQGLRVTYALHKPTGAVPPPAGAYWTARTGPPIIDPQTKPES